MNDLLSVIVLSYKNGLLLKETIDSILFQDYPAIELLICDDASPDFDQMFYSQYIADNKRSNLADARFIINERNQGTVKNLNGGIKAAKGPFIKIIAGDDCVSSSDVFSRQVQYLLCHPQAYFVVGNSVHCDEKMNPLQETGFMTDENNPLFHNQKRMMRYICRKNQNALATQAICFRKVFFEEYGLYDERFYLVEDLPLAVRTIEDSVCFGYMNYPCVKHRGSGGVSTSANAFDVKRIRYYEDLEQYFLHYLLPNRKAVGALHVSMRYKVAKFRVQYCKLMPPTRIRKAALVLKNVIPLAYYAITKMGRAFFYLIKK